MKKQILILIVALFAVTSAFGQQYKNPDTKVWVAPTCGASDAYHPAAGVEYTYEVAISGPTGAYDGNGNYTWKVTNDADLLAVSDVPGTEYAVTTGSGGATHNNIKITWAASSIGQTYYVVVDYNEVNATGTKACDLNNIKVFPVKPRNAFWLDINASTDGSTAASTSLASFDVCPPDVTRAEMTTTGDITTARVTYEFGVTTLYAIIHAAGYTGAFDASLKVSGLADNQVATIAGWTTTAAAPGNGTYTKSLTSASAGVDIPVTIVITNNQYETRVDQEIKISIDGSYTTGGTTYDDLYDQTTPLLTCTTQPADADYIFQTIKARPTITDTTPADFATPNPALRP